MIKKCIHQKIQSTVELIIFQLIIFIDKPLDNDKYKYFTDYSCLTITSNLITSYHKGNNNSQL